MSLLHVADASHRLPEPGGFLGASRREWAAIVGAWTMLALLMALSRILDPRFGHAHAGHELREIVRSLSSFLFWVLATPLVFELCRRYGVDRHNWPYFALLHLGIGLAVSYGATVYDNALRVFVFPFPKPDGPPASAASVFGFRLFWFLNDLIIYAGVLAAGFARDYFKRYRERLEEANQLRAALAEARLETLRIQLNPHFLFNTLHAVSSLVERDPKGVRRMIARLSALLRYTLDESNLQEVPLHQEMAFLNDYLEIQQIRFQDSLTVREEIAPEALDAMVPSMILQPLVENAIKHGVSKTEGRGLIVLRARRDGERLRLSVQDNGPGFQSGDGAESALGGVGLRNTLARLEGLYGLAHSLTFRNAPEGGFLAEITLPYHRAGDLRTQALSIGAEAR